MRPTFYGTIQRGKLTLDNRDRFELYIGSLSGRVELTIQKYRKVRTTGKVGQRSNMNGYYWLYLGVIADETGDNINDLHEYFKRVLLPPRFIKVFGKEIKIPATTTELTGNEMWQYMLRIEQLTNIPIPPHPDENDFN